MAMYPNVLKYWDVLKILNFHVEHLKKKHLKIINFPFGTINFSFEHLNH